MARRIYDAGVSELAAFASPRFRFATAAALLLGLHLLGFFYFVPLAAWATHEPMPGIDYETHIAQTWRFLTAMDGWGRTWIYDPQLLAGYPHGVIFDADNKGWQAWTWALTRFGVSPGLAFNLFVVAAHLLVMPVVYTSARLLRLHPCAALTAAAMASLLWFFDGFAHWCWWVGMVAYAFASYLCLLPMALFYRWLDDRRPWQAVATAVMLGLCHLVHPYSFFILVVPLTWLYLRRFRSLGWRGHAVVVAIAATPLVVNGWWLAVALRFWHYILDSGLYGQSGLEFVLGDVAGLNLDTSTAGMIGARTGFRTAICVTAVLGLLRWRRASDPRVAHVAAAMIVLAALTYLGSYLWLTRQIQPYRHVLPLALLATLPAASFVCALVRDHAWRSLAWAPRVACGLLAIPASQHLLADVLYYLPETLPQLPRLYNGGKPVITSQGFGHQPVYRHRPRTPADDLVSAWVRSHDDGQQRFLVEEPSLGEQLTWSTSAQVLGGFTYRNLQHSHANLFRRRKGGVAGDDELQAYFTTYAVGYVIISHEPSRWDRRPAILEPVAKLGPHRVYRTKISPQLVVRGGGQVVATANRLQVTGSNPNEDLVLRFHWLETLVCRPDCQVSRVPVDSFDAVGFIKIPAPHPADLELHNGYR